MIADLTGLNPNVHYEIGIRHSFCLPTILLMDAVTKPPFDLLDQRIISYDLHSADGLDRAVHDLVQRLSELSVWRSPVCRALLRGDDFEFVCNHRTRPRPSRTPIRELVDELESVVREVLESVEGADDSSERAREEWDKRIDKLLTEIHTKLPPRLRVKGHSDEPS